MADFNTKQAKCCSTDKNNKAGSTLENITLTLGYNQMINTPSHFTNGSSSCIDLIFSSNTSYLIWNETIHLR